MFKTHVPVIRLKISAVCHQAFIRVDESGTEAGAATAVVMGRGAAPPSEIKTYVVDRPFVCVLFHRKLASALFVGLVKDPSS